MATMKAVRIHTYGGPEVLRYEDAPRPVPAAGEVLIKIHAAAVNPVDWKVRAGHLKDMLKYQLPLIPGWDAAGVIEDVGAGVSRLKQVTRFTPALISRATAPMQNTLRSASQRWRSSPNLSTTFRPPRFHWPLSRPGKRFSMRVA